jgi:hypothetical protein
MPCSLTLSLDELRPLARALSELGSDTVSPLLARLFAEAQPQANAGATTFTWSLETDEVAVLASLLDEALDQAGMAGDFDLLGDLGSLRDRIRSLDGV